MPSDKDKNNIFSHHAYFVEGNQTSLEALTLILEKSGFKTHANPDFQTDHFEKLGINESRAIKEESYRAPYGDKKVYIVSCDSITSEAQNSLLKTFEEPISNSYFYLIIPKEDILLPTLRSRMLKLNIERPDDSGEEATSFLKMNLDERLVFAHKFADDIRDEKKTKKDAEDFVNSLEKILFKKREDFSAEDLKKFLDIKSYLSNRGSSVKIILETISIILPAI